jgi:Fur family iron response transcriptional regulator
MIPRFSETSRQRPMTAHACAPTPSSTYADARDAHRPGCPLSELRDKLRRVGLRPTRQRVLLGWLLFCQG